MKTLLALVSLLCILQVAAAQEQSDRVARASGWENVLPAGSLKPGAQIVAVDRGFVLAAESFKDPSWRFGSPWQLYDPAAGRWSGYEKPSEESALMALSDDLLARLDIAHLIPDVPGIRYQYVDAGNKLAFLIPDDYMFAETSFYSDLVIVDPAQKTATSRHLWFCEGPPKAELVLWDFPEQELSVICNLVISHADDSMRFGATDAFIGRNRPSPLQLVSHSPDQRYWIMREAQFYRDDTGNFYAYDRHTGQTAVLLWNLPSKPQRDLFVWLSNSSVLTNVGDYILHLDMAKRLRHELLREEIAGLPGDIALMTTTLSRDGAWLLVATGDGALFQRSVATALAAHALPDRIRSAD